MPLETPGRIVSELARRGYNADREAVTLLAGADEPGRALERAVETAPDDAIKISTDHVRAVLTVPDTVVSAPSRNDTQARPGRSETPGSHAGAAPTSGETATPSDAASGATVSTSSDTGAAGGRPDPDDDPTDSSGESRGAGGYTGEGVAPETGEGTRPIESAALSVDITGDVTGRSTGTGTYDDFVTVFRDRYERLSKQLRSRVNHRSTDALAALPGGSEAGLVGMVAGQRTTTGGHWILDLEDTAGTFPCLVLKDREVAGLMDEILNDEVLAVEGTLADDGEVLFVDDLYFPEVPRTYEPSTADRHVRAALVSDVHVGSREFDAESWSRFAAWLHTEEAEGIEYLLVAGDMVEGVGVYPGQDEELDVVDIYAQYEAFSEHLKAVPGDMEIVMIPGNHDAVRLAEPQPGFDEELRAIMSAHDARITGNPSTVDLEGVSVLMYHGVSLDEVIAEFPDAKASYDHPERAMYRLLKKRHVAPQFGGKTRLAPEERDYLVIDEVPDVFHAGHVHKLGYGKYRNVLAVNSGCWQTQTAFQRSVNIDPDVGYAPVVDLDTLDLTVYRFT